MAAMRPRRRSLQQHASGHIQSLVYSENEKARGITIAGGEGSLVHHDSSTDALLDQKIVNQTIPNINLTSSVLQALQGKKSRQVSDISQKGQIPTAASGSTFFWLQYPTTASLIIVLNLMFLYQFYKRRRRKQVMTSYHHVFRRKRFHRLWLAAFSHPPLPSSVTWRSLSRRCSMSSGSSSSQRRNYQSHLRHHQEALKQIINGLVKECQGPLAGLLLLLYNSHLLWSVRALEVAVNVQQDSQFAYARTILVIWSCSLLLELGVYHFILTILTPIATNELVRNHIAHQSVGTCTYLTSALVLIFSAKFHHAPIPVLPFVANPLVHFYPPGWNIFLVILLLSLLMRNTKCGKMTVLCGILIGSYWTDGISSFLGDAYYGKAWIASLGLATALSYKASYRDSLPCIDSVGWDQRGRLLHESSSMEIVVVDGELLLVEAADYDDDAESLDENADDDDEFYIENLHEGHGDIELPPGTDDASSYGRTNDMAFDDNGSEEQQSLLPTNRRRGRSTRTQSGRRRR